MNLAPELREFVAAKIGSPEQLELFALLSRNRTRWWTVAELAEQMDAAPEAVGMRSFLLTSAGLLQSESSPDLRYQFKSDPALHMVADAILAAYDHDRNALFEDVFGRLPPDPATKFAAAFKVRKS